MGFRMWSWLAISAPPEQPVRGAAGHQWLDAYSAASRGRAATIPARVLRSPACVSHFSVLQRTVAGCSPLERANFIRRSTVGEGRIAKDLGDIDIRSWHFRTSQLEPDECPLSGVKRICRERTVMSANDPKRTLGIPHELHAHPSKADPRLLKKGV